MSVALLLLISRRVYRAVVRWRWQRSPAALAGPFVIYRP